MYRVLYVEAEERHSLKHEFARRTLGYCAGQAGFFKHALARASHTTFTSMNNVLKQPSRYLGECDAVVFSSKSGIRKMASSDMKQLLSKLKIPIAVLVHEARPQFMIEEEIADYCSVIFKREPFIDLSRYDLSPDNLDKIVPTILANPLNPLFNRLPWLTIGARPSQFGYEALKQHDTFFLGRVGKNRYNNRVDAWTKIFEAKDVDAVGGLIPTEVGFSVSTEHIAEPINSAAYRRNILKARVNLALDGIGPFTFRHLELFWSGAFCLSETDLGAIWLREAIVAGRDYVFFENWDDMVDKVRFYARNDSIRDAIARSGREFYERLYDVDAHALELRAAIFPEDETTSLCQT